MGSAVPLAELVAMGIYVFSFLWGTLPHCTLLVLVFIGFFNPDGTPVHEGTAKTISQGASTSVAFSYFLCSTD